LRPFQFETIHPFLDGNGRLSRLLVAFLWSNSSCFRSRCCTSVPTSSSTAVSTTTGLQAVRERGELREWLAFFLTGVAELAKTSARSSTP